MRRDQTEINQQATFITTQVTRFQFYQSLPFARAQVADLREQLIPQAEATMEQTRYSYKRGRFFYLALADALRVLITLQHNAIEAAATYHHVRAEIERFTTHRWPTRRWRPPRIDCHELEKRYDEIFGYVDIGCRITVRLRQNAIRCEYRTG